MKHKNRGSCPICNERYEVNHLQHEENGHHIFPKFWYHGQGPKVPICRKCHDDFNAMNPMGKSVWTLYQCLNRWNKFCKIKGKVMLDIYPQLGSYIQELSLPIE